MQERDNAQGSFVDITLAVAEGPRTMVGDVTFKGLTAVDEATLRQALTVKSGAAFYEPQLATSREAIQTQYLNRGFDRIAVDATPVVSTDQTRADIVFTVQEGAQLFIDRIVIVGNRRTDIRTIEKGAHDRARQAARAVGAVRKPAPVSARSGCSAACASRTSASRAKRGAT